MGKGGVAKRIVDVFQALVGHLTGGLSIAATITCMFFGAISGSSAATVSAVGGFMVPEMIKKNYDPGFSATVAASAGTMGLLIPPSVSFVIYGIVSQSSIGDLFIAGIIPGILMCVALSIVCYYYSRKYHFGGAERVPLKHFFKIVWEGKWALFTPVIILGGIYTGIFSPTESAVVAVVYALIVSFFIYKELDLKGLYEAMLDTMILNGMIMYMLGVATVFAKYLTLAQVPDKLVNFITGITDNRILLLLMLNAILLVLGCFVDNIPIIIIMTPIMLPVATAAGLTAIQFGVVMVLNTTIGLVTPPYGPNLFIAAKIANIKLERMLKYVWTFLLSLIVVLMIVTYIPNISTFLIK